MFDLVFHMNDHTIFWESFLLATHLFFESKNGTGHKIYQTIPCKFHPQSCSSGEADWTLQRFASRTARALDGNVVGGLKFLKS